MMASDSSPKVLDNPRDVALVGVSVVQLLLWIFLLSSWKSAHWALLFLGACAQVILVATQFQTVSHYFIHRPFFHNANLNAIFSALNSINLSVPTCFYWAHHMNHHRFNDSLDDSSSTWKYGRSGNQEVLWKYALLSPFRTDFSMLWREAGSHYSMRARLMETAVFLIFLMLTVYISLSAFVATIFILYLGQSLAAAENFLEHAGTDSRNPFRNSVSCYSKWYNIVWFNNGYHQEHHFRPRAHWSELPAIEGKLPPRSDRVTIHGAHWLFWNRHKEKETSSWK